MDGFAGYTTQNNSRHNSKSQVKSSQGIHNVVLVHRCSTKMVASDFLITICLAWYNCHMTTGVTSTFLGTVQVPLL